MAHALNKQLGLIHNRGWASGQKALAWGKQLERFMGGPCPRTGLRVSPGQLPPLPLSQSLNAPNPAPSLHQPRLCASQDGCEQK